MIDAPRREFCGQWSKAFKLQFQWTNGLRKVNGLVELICIEIIQAIV